MDIYVDKVIPKGGKINVIVPSEFEGAVMQCAGVINGVS
jgi:hypothetical protein